MWFKSGNTSLDLRDVSSVMLDEFNKGVVITMKSGQKVYVQTEENVTPVKAYKLLTGLLDDMRDRDDRNDRIMADGFELFKGTLSELKSISQELKSISQHLRRLRLS